jgi:hypothetical protein
MKLSSLEEYDPLGAWPSLIDDVRANLSALAFSFGPISKILTDIYFQILVIFTLLKNMDRAWNFQFVEYCKRNA